MKDKEKETKELDIDAYAAKTVEKKKVLRRRRRSTRHNDLHPHHNEIMRFAFTPAGSQQGLSEFVSNFFKLRVSRSIIYRYVKAHNDGVFPHAEYLKKLRSKK